MKCVILCGGQGSRIREISEIVPKPMLPIGEYPILWHIMNLYAAHGVTEFILCLGYKGSVIRQYFLNYQAMVADCTVTLGKPREIELHAPTGQEDWRVTLVDTGDPTQTGGRILRVRKYLVGDDHFCVTYGDGVADVNLRELLETHRSSGRAGTVTAVRVAGRFGELQIDQGVVQAFNEKPVVSSGHVSGGFFVFDNRRCWDFFDTQQGDGLVLEREPLTRMAAACQLGTYAHDGYWQCMDTPREFAALNELWATGRAPWRI